ncbi:hypothetical protein Aab01nite_79710 [Paractinoplanes abujensis]|uniref:Golgi phosphoprotein 3 GPP34 n=1 Tax=Paractinoplanes abujensis TaxID=882441 RepID=A0A7W7CR46_9ACTN|nr:GPP34 family phosphoprotein [Actinoplanes abujensis]MBB4693180.1 hypothetical protein [Actinoplanes abujensis]GID24381.1 hypothetical protein Aab01nite_79710 [Actinoplanes abujensis]
MTPQLGPPILAEDVLLLVTRFVPAADVAGEHALFPVLAAAVLADLGLGSHVRMLPGRGGSARVEAVAEREPADEVLHVAWKSLLARPRGVQAALAVIGPTLRSPLLDRLVRRGDLRRTAPEGAGPAAVENEESGRRAGLVAVVRDVLAGKADAPRRDVALAAVLSASGLLRRFDPEISWTSTVIVRAGELEREVPEAGAAAEAVGRAVATALVENVIVAAAALPGPDRPDDRKGGARGLEHP